MTDNPSDAVRDADDAIQEELEGRLDEEVARAKHCLAALRAASVPFDCVTGHILQELGANMIGIIHEAIDEPE